jgi:saccharopine dehydrogenase-like NADP-dependent oxidoreductase
MVVVAVAGGTGDVGRTIVEEISRDPLNTVYVFTRKVKFLLLPSELNLKTRQSKPGSTPKATPGTSIILHEVDYSDISELSAVLVRLQVDTVISALNLHWPGAAGAQINLIRAAAEAGVVKRFIPSEYNIDWNCPEE